MECKNVFEIYTGNNKVIPLKFLTGPYGDPIDLSSCTELDVALPNADGTFAHLKLTTNDVTIPDPKLLGKANVAVSPQVSALLNVGQFQDFFATLTIGGVVTTVTFEAALTVYQI